jgi:hypothetical protein
MTRQVMIRLLKLLYLDKRAARAGNYSADEAAL